MRSTAGLNTVEGELFDGSSLGLNVHLGLSSFSTSSIGELDLAREELEVQGYYRDPETS